MSCPALRVFWNVNFVGNVANAQSSLSIFDWIYEVSCRLVVPQLELFYISLWVIWSERNNIVWNASGFDPIFMSSWASRLLEEYRGVILPLEKKEEDRFLSGSVLQVEGLRLMLMELIELMVRLEALAWWFVMDLGIA